MGFSFLLVHPTQSLMQSCYLFIFSFTLFSCLVLGAINCPGAGCPYPEALAPLNFTASGGNDMIFYQSSNLYTLQNVANPITVTISYTSGGNFPASICLNPDMINSPISGVFLENTCPAGAYGSISNRTLTNGDKSDTPKHATRETITASLFVRPSNVASAGFIVTIPNSDSVQDFVLNWEGSQCVDPTLFPVGSNQQCVPINELANNQVIPIGANSWQYYRITLNKFTSTSLNNIQINVNGTDDGISMYLQKGYIPSADWFLNPLLDTSVDNTVGASILTPSTFSSSEVFYLGVFNSNEHTSVVSISTTVGTCETTQQFGYNCQHTSATTTDPLAGYLTLSATLTQGANNSATVNGGESLNFDYTKADEGDYAYFKLINYPDIPTPYNVRVTVANNDITDSNGAPAVFAKLGGYPSAQSHHYNMSNTGNVVHQLSLPITSTSSSDDNAWYIAVKLPVDLVIWAGVNCADGCDSDKHGSCYCGSVTCSSATNSYSDNMDIYYQLPNTTIDSGGACTCENYKWEQSYDCSEKNNGRTPAFLAIIFILGLLVLVVSVAVPVYCWFKTRKRGKRIELDDEEM